VIADREFVISDYGALFTNGTFGWPAFLYTNIPGGGPGYPMGTLGLRVAVNPWEWLTLGSAVFQGNVFDQNVNRHGFRWNLNSDQGYFWINELQVRWNQGESAKGFRGRENSAHGFTRRTLQIRFSTKMAYRWLMRLRAAPPEPIPGTTVFTGFWTRWFTANRLGLSQPRASAGMESRLLLQKQAFRPPKGLPIKAPEQKFRRLLFRQRAGLHRDDPYPR
jgi:Carbohydrate-selective porin, OprB family